MNWLKSLLVVAGVILLVGGVMMIAQVEQDSPAKIVQEVSQAGAQVALAGLVSAMVGLIIPSTPRSRIPWK